MLISTRKKLISIFLSFMVTTQSTTVHSIHTTQLPNITVFVHGTLPPVLNHLIHALDCPLGLTKADQLNPKFIQSRIPFVLSKTDSNVFPLEHFYIFGWSGNLSLSERRKAAHGLYHELKKLHGTITLICHSHGCNVALNLALIAQNHKDTNFAIDTLIFLAGPVQEITKNYVHAPIFKKVFSFYSLSDLTQIADPQGLYHKQKDTELSFFSERLWPDGSHIMQTQVCFGKKDLWHTHFIMERFLKHLPHALEKLIELKKVHAKNHYLLTIDKKLDALEVAVK